MTEQIDTKARLTEAKVRQIIGLLAEGRVRSEIAKQFGVGDTTIRRIANGEAWKQVPRPTNFANTVRHSTAKLTEAQVRDQLRPVATSLIVDCPTLNSRATAC